MKGLTIERTIGAALVALAAAASASAEDLTIISRVDMGKGKTATSTQYLAKDKVRTSDRESGTILELATGRIVIINDKKKEYYESTMQDLAAAMQKLQQRISAKMMMVKLDTLTEATEVKKGPIPASAFEITAGYTKKEPPFKKAA